jgi:hypothetical protein
MYLQLHPLLLPFSIVNIHLWWSLAWAYSQAGLFGLDYAQLPHCSTNEVAIIVG